MLSACESLCNELHSSQNEKFTISRAKLEAIENFSTMSYALVMCSSQA